jgi:hypothetical protein
MHALLEGVNVSCQLFQIPQWASAATPTFKQYDGSTRILFGFHRFETIPFTESGLFEPKICTTGNSDYLSVAITNVLFVFFNPPTPAF